MRHNRGRDGKPDESSLARESVDGEPGDSQACPAGNLPQGGQAGLSSAGIPEAPCPVPGEPDFLELLERSGALRKGHFRLSSGRHSDTYIQCALLLRDPGAALAAGRAIARISPPGVDLVLSPALGGVIIGFAVACAMERPMMFAERHQGTLALRRGFRLESGTRVLLVEDVITTGGSIMELSDLAGSAGAEVAGLACLVERGGGIEPGVPLSRLVRVQAASWDPRECPLCAAGEEVDSPGSRYR